MWMRNVIIRVALLPCQRRQPASLLHRAATKISWSQYRSIRHALSYQYWPISGKRCFHLASCLQDSDVVDVDAEEEGVTDDTEYNKYVKEVCGIPDCGHRVYVVQPYIKYPQGKRQLSTNSLRLEETCALIATLPRWQVMDKTTIPIRKPGLPGIFSENNLHRLREILASRKDISAVVLGIDLIRPTELQVIQRTLKLPILDRFTIVLQIFKDHAKTREAKLQVALAEIPYIRSRLAEVSEGQHDRQTSAGQYIGGTGETWIHLRKKLLQRRELRLRKLLTQVKSQRSLLRKNRQKKQIPTVAVVGYTNAGKTSLILALTSDSSLTPEDKLFATLDVTTHAGRLPNRMMTLYVDTVGFLSDIPVMLIDAFEATLEDAVLADLVIHVLDCSHPDVVSQQHTVQTTLRSMLSRGQMESVIEVWNKVDLTQARPDGLAVSATTGEGLSELMERVQNQLVTVTRQLEKTFRVPMSGDHLGWLYKNSTVTDTKADTDPDYMLVDVIITQPGYSKFKAKFAKPMKS